MDPANAFTFNGAVGDARTSFGSMRGERVHANAAQFSSAASPWALSGGGSGACAPPVDLAALVQLTAWIKALSELGITGYGFAPLKLTPDLDFPAMFHGVDERVPLEALDFGHRALTDFLLTY